MDANRGPRVQDYPQAKPANHALSMKMTEEGRKACPQ